MTERPEGLWSGGCRGLDAMRNLADRALEPAPK